MVNTIWLSYPLNDKAFGYGNGQRFRLEKLRDMDCGDSSNNTGFSMPTHYGTHIDFPSHFSSTGKKSTDYPANHFVFEKVSLIEIDPNTITDFLIRNEHLDLSKLSQNTELLILKTGFCAKRYNSEYWEYGLGFHSETANFLKTNLPNIRCIAFDLISMNSYQNRAEGRIAHKEFLIENEILIVEEMDLNHVDLTSKFKEVIIAPLMIENADGAPVSVLAKML